MPSYPGSDNLSFRPLVDISRARGNDQFEFEAPDVGADLVARRGDDWLLSAGPRVTFADETYNRSYFSVAAGSPSGLPPFTAGGGLQSVGATLGYVRQITRPLGDV